MPLPAIGAIGAVFKVGKGIFKGLRAKRKRKKAAKQEAKAAKLEQQSSAIFNKLGLGTAQEFAGDKAQVSKQIQDTVFASDQTDTNQIQSLGATNYDAESDGAKASFASEGRRGKRGMNPILKWVLIGVGSLVGLVLLFKLLVPSRRR